MANMSNFLKKVDMNNTKVLSNTNDALTMLNFLFGYMTVEFVEIKKSLVNVSLLNNFQIEFDRNLTAEQFIFHNSQWNKTNADVDEIKNIFIAQQQQLKLLLLAVVSINVILLSIILLCVSGACIYSCRKVCASTGKYKIDTSPESAHIYAYQKRVSAKTQSTHLDTADIELGGIGEPDEKVGVMETEL